MVFELNKGVLNTLYAKITETKGKNGIIAFKKFMALMTDTPAQLKLGDA